MKCFGFKGGVHPPENKIQTEAKIIEILPAPETVYIPLRQHIGVKLTPCVSVGDKVLKGEIIADAKEFMAVPVHATVSGTIKKIEVLPFPVMGMMETIVIENDNENTWCELEKITNWQNTSKEELLEMIKNKGVVGAGGATFPTHIKLNPPIGTKIDTLLLNGAECEPYLNSDNRIMQEEANKIIIGAQIMMKILDIKTCIIGIEDNKPNAIKIMKKVAVGQGIKIEVLETKYPQGGEKELIKSILDREVPCGKLPSSVGVVVHNTTTAAKVYEAIVKGKPMIEQVVTVSGLGVKKPKNLKVTIGTPISKLLEMCEYDESVTEKVVTGGPMMGMAQSTLEVPVIKGTSGVLALTLEETNYCEPAACLVCGKCVDVCPMFLEPLMFTRLVSKSQWSELNEYNLKDCIECGSCAYTCPSNRPLTESIKIGKSQLRTIGK